MAAANGRERDSKLARSSAALLILNLLDGVLTTIFLQLDLAEEANPLMRLCYERSPLVFMTAKLVIVNGGLLLLWSARQLSAARAAITWGARLYAGIGLWHAAFLVRLWAH